MKPLIPSPLRIELLIPARTPFLRSQGGSVELLNQGGSLMKPDLMNLAIHRLMPTFHRISMSSLQSLFGR